MLSLNENDDVFQLPAPRDEGLRVIALVLILVCFDLTHDEAWAILDNLADRLWSLSDRDKCFVVEDDRLPLSDIDGKGDGTGDSEIIASRDPSISLL